LKKELNGERLIKSQRTIDFFISYSTSK